MSTCQAIVQNMQNSEPLVSQYVNLSSLQGIKKEIHAHIEKNTLQVMLYGAYNAGKSSLINALLGEERAKVKDIPTTDKIDEYDWQGYKLLDTPGVNAPIAHEQITSEQIKRTMAVLFVIREGDQDCMDVYQRLFTLLKKGKQVFIVLNHQLASQDEKRQAYQKKIVDTLCLLATQFQGTTAQIQDIAVFPINVKTALNAHLKGNEKLLEHSGFSHFLHAFNAWVKQQDTIEQFYQHTKNMVNTLWYAPALAMLQNNNEDSQSAEQKALQHDLRMLISQQRELEREAYSLISYEVSLMKSQISQLLRNSRDQADFDSALIAIFAPLQSKLEQWLNSKLDELTTSLTVSVKHLLKEAQEDKNNPFLNALGEQMRNFLRSEDNLKDIFKMARSFKIPGFKGRWEKTLGKWAGKAAIGVQVVTFLWDAHKANQAQNDYNRREKEQAIELYQAVDQICTLAIKELSDTIAQAIAPIFSAKTQIIEARLEELSINQSKHQQNDQALQKCIAELNAI